MGIRVLIDFCISHASRNEDDGIANTDGSRQQYQYPGERGYQKEWDAIIFDVTKLEVIRFLLSSLHYYSQDF